MLEQQNLGKLCPYSVTCPVYQERLIVERVPPFLIRNVFCNRGQKGWNNCVRYRLIAEDKEAPVTATPYKQF
ncbi:MAG: hypothetical protein AB7V25_00750 [Mangrovibacterium sp.]